MTYHSKECILKIWDHQLAHRKYCRDLIFSIFIKLNLSCQTVPLKCRWNTDFWAWNPTCLVQLNGQYYVSKEFTFFSFSVGFGFSSSPSNTEVRSTIGWIKNKKYVSNKCKRDSRALSRVPILPTVPNPCLSFLALLLADPLFFSFLFLLSVFSYSTRVPAACLLFSCLYLPFRTTLPSSLFITRHLGMYSSLFNLTVPPTRLPVLLLNIPVYPVFPCICLPFCPFFCLFKHLIMTNDDLFAVEGYRRECFPKEAIETVSVPQDHKELKH
jgi:hypothetical protein